MQTATVLRGAQARVIDADWGQLTWYAEGALGNSGAATVGRCIIKPGHSNPLHFHTASEEILVVASGQIAHTLSDGEEVVLEQGDVITVPAGMPHNARNIGDEDAVLNIVFPTAVRDFVPVEPK